MSQIKKFNILNVDPRYYSRAAIETLNLVGIYREQECVSREEFLNDIADIEVLVIRFSFVLDKEFFARARNLKFIICNVTGPNHIDEDEMKRKGVTLFCLRGYYDFLTDVHATAELTWQLIMATQRPIFEAVNSVKSGGWDRDLFVGNELYGKSIGIIGVGRIGKKILKYSKCFGLNVHVFDINPEPEDDVIVHNSLESIFSNRLDIYTIHLPLVSSTKGLIGPSYLRKLQRGSSLVNTSRGEIVDEDYINRKSIENGFKYYSDVICNESDFSKSVFYNSELLDENVVLTPHIGGAAYEAWWKTEEFCVKNFIDYIK